MTHMSRSAPTNGRPAGSVKTAPPRFWKCSQGGRKHDASQHAHVALVNQNKKNKKLFGLKCFFMCVRVAIIFFSHVIAVMDNENKMAVTEIVRNLKSNIITVIDLVSKPFRDMTFVSHSGIVCQPTACECVWSSWRHHQFKRSRDSNMRQYRYNVLCMLSNSWGSASVPKQIICKVKEATLNLNSLSIQIWVRKKGAASENHEPNLSPINSERSSTASPLARSQFCLPFPVRNLLIWVIVIRPECFRANRPPIRRIGRAAKRQLWRHYNLKLWSDTTFS